MSEIIGSFSPFAPSGEQLSLTMHPDSYPVRWCLCSLTANFAADYFVDLLAGGERRSPSGEEARSAISYVVNELVENAVKFNTSGDIRVHLGLEQQELVCVVSNQIGADTAPALREKLTELATGDPSELMLRQVEANAEAGDSGSSGLGFLLIMNDYNTSLGWKLERLGAHHFRVSTMARIPVAIEQ